MITSLVIVASVTILGAGLGLTAWWIDRPEKPHHKPAALKRALRVLVARKPALDWSALARRPLAAADTRTLAWVRAIARPMEAARVQAAVLAFLIGQAHGHHEDPHPLPGPLPVHDGPLFSDDTSWRQFTALKEVV